MPLDIRGHPTWVPLVHTLKTVADLLAFYKKELAPERSAQNDWIPDLNKDGSHDIRDLAELKERLYRVQDTNGDGIADTSKIMIEGFNADPTYDVVGGVALQPGRPALGIAPGVFRLKDDNGDGTIDRQITISEGYSTHPAFGGHGISGLMMGPDGRIYWEVGDIGLDVTDKSGKRWSYPNQGAVMRSDPDGSNFEVFAAGIRNLQEFSFDEYGNLISVDNDGDHQGENERVVYIPNGSDSGWRSNWQYGKYTDPKNNRYNVWMDEQHAQAALRRPGGVHRPAGRVVSQRAVGHGLQPGHGAVGGVAQQLLRHELSGRGGERAHLRVQAEGERRRVLARERQGAAARHPGRRVEVRSRRRALPHRLDHRLGLEGQGTHLEARRAAGGREPDARRSAHAASRHVRRRVRRRSVDAAAARRHARFARRRSSSSCAAATCRRSRAAARESTQQARAHPRHLGHRAAGAHGKDARSMPRS